MHKQIHPERDGYVKTEAEIGVMWPQVETCPEPSEAEGTGSL